MKKNYGLHHSERLRTLGAVRRLFQSGRSGFVYPIRYICLSEADSVQSAEVLFSVPKKFHKRANKRNTLRRRVKEAYRLHKSLLLESQRTEPQAFDIALVYSTRECHSYKTIENAVRKILAELAKGT